MRWQKHFKEYVQSVSELSSLSEPSEDTDSFLPPPPTLRKNAATPPDALANILIVYRYLSEVTTSKELSNPPKIEVQSCWPTVMQQFNIAICIATLAGLPACSASLFHT